MKPANSPCQRWSCVPMGALAAILLVAPVAQAQVPLHQRIDQEIEAGLPNFASNAAPVAGDEEFVRRIYLDFTGITPTAQQVKDFVKAGAMDKRAKLIDQLLASPEYAHHMQHVFDVLWMERRPDKNVPAVQWQKFLHESFAQNKPYDQLVRDVLAADGSDAKTRAAAKFYLDRNGEPHEITKDVSRLFLGMNLHCAQCHDHPLVEAYKQDHYYGVYGFFSRSYLFNDKQKKMSVFAEKAEGKISFQSVFMPKVVKETTPKLPGLPPLKEPEIAKGKEYTVAATKDVAGVPAFSRRAQLPGLLASADNIQFKRAAANRFWFLLLGRGLIHPLDYDHAANPPSHVKLLDVLAEEFAAMKFDIKKLLREIALSKTYQRSSKMPAGKELPGEDRFALAEVRALSPEQLGWSLLQATGLRELEFKAQGAKASEPAVYAKLGNNVTPFVKTFGGQPGDPADLGFQATLDQTLFIKNGPLIRGWLTPRPGGLTDRMLKAKDDAALAEELVLSVLSRQPTDAERTLISNFLKANGADRSAAVQELAWAFIATAEFRFNH